MSYSNNKYEFWRSLRDPGAPEVHGWMDCASGTITAMLADDRRPGVYM